MLKFIENILKINAENKEINLKLIEKNTLLMVKTKNSIYEIFCSEDYKTTIKGGSRYPKHTPVKIAGCGTVPNVLLKLNTIAYKMRMEFYDEEKQISIVTSPVLNVTIIAPDNDKEYSLDWEKDCTL
jgi:hypothetical protein